MTETQFRLSVTLSRLDRIDFARPPHRFMAHYRQIRIGCGQYPWPEKPPEASCQYGLAHFPGKISWGSLLSAPLGAAVSVDEVCPHTRVEFAGFRELLAYADTVRPEELGDCTLVALGSKIEHPTGAPDDVVPIAMVESGSGNVGIHYRSTKTDFTPDHYFLVRVYDKRVH